MESDLPYLPCEIWNLIIMFYVNLFAEPRGTFSLFLSCKLFKEILSTTDIQNKFLKKRTDAITIGDSKIDKQTGEYVFYQRHVADKTYFINPNKTKHGVEQLKYKNSPHTEEFTYVNGILHGSYLCINKYGTKTIGNYVNGKKDGLFQTFTKYGKLIKEETYSYTDQDWTIFETRRQKKAKFELEKREKELEKFYFKSHMGNFNRTNI